MAEAGEKAIRNYKKGQDVDAVILAIDAERERISLGIKQLEEDVISAYIAMNPKGTVVNWNSFLKSHLIGNG